MDYHTCEQAVFNSYTIGTSGLPDIYTHEGDNLKYHADQRVDQRITESHFPRQYLDIVLVPRYCPGNILPCKSF